jgi:hypothetical protein
MDDEKPLYWVGSALDDLRALPAEVKDVFGFALHLAQWGDRHPDAKPLKGFKGASVLEVVEDYDGIRFVLSTRCGLEKRSLYSTYSRKNPGRESRHQSRIGFGQTAVEAGGNLVSQIDGR